MNSNTTPYFTPITTPCVNTADSSIDVSNSSKTTEQMENLNHINEMIACRLNENLKNNIENSDQDLNDCDEGSNNNSSNITNSTTTDDEDNTVYNNTALTNTKLYNNDTLNESPNLGDIVIPENEDNNENESSFNSSTQENEVSSSNQEEEEDNENNESNATESSNE